MQVFTNRTRTDIGSIPQTSRLNANLHNCPIARNLFPSIECESALPTLLLSPYRIRQTQHDLRGN